VRMAYVRIPNAAEYSLAVSPDTCFGSDGVSAANLDGEMCHAETGESILIEAKVVGPHAPRTERDQWGDDGTDQVPHRVLIQVHHQMLCTEIKVAYVAALIRSEFHLYRIERDEELCQSIAECNKRFWKDHVEPRIPPG